MKTFKYLLGIIAVLLLMIWGVLYYFLNNYKTISAYQDLYIAPAINPPADALTVTYVGISTMLFRDRDQSILIDGFFTRHPASKLLFGKIGPKEEDIAYALNRLNINELDAVLVVHSHFDHGMDAPEVAKRTGATVYGSESTANISRGWGLPEAQIGLFVDRQPIQIGQFTVTPILSNHFQFPDPETRKMALEGGQIIKEPLVPPVKVMDYKMGGHYTLYVEHPKRDFLIQGSAGWKANSLDGIETEVVFLGVGGLGSQTVEYQEQYFREIVDQVNAQQVYIIHWDSFCSPIDEPIQGPNLFVEYYFPARTDATFATLKKELAKRPSVNGNLLPQWKPIVLGE